ncbi:MAG: hypothetical protein ACE5ID_07845 [Acidobacteriota bacterium]
MSTAPAKRPYVGHSMLRTLWYLFALAGVLLVAFLIPGEPAKVNLQGDWRLQSTGEVAGLPAGRVHLMVTGQRYALEFEAREPGADPAAGMEMGEIPAFNGTLTLKPVLGVYLNAAGVWQSKVPSARTFTIHRDGESMILTDMSTGAALAGRPYDAP